MLSLTKKSLKLQVMKGSPWTRCINSWPKKHRVIVIGVSASISQLESGCKKLAPLICVSQDAKQKSARTLSLSLGFL